MAEYLLISGRDADSVANLLAVAADVVGSNENAQVDIAVPTIYADIALLSSVVRRVVSIDPPVMPDMKVEAKSGGLAGKLSKFAKNIASTAAKNFRDYKEIVNELRISNYDAVFDFDASAFSVTVARAAKTDKIIGFSAEFLIDPVPGATLMYHETKPIGKDDNTFLKRGKKLVANYLDYPVPPLEWKINIPDLPSWAPNEPFILVGDKTPAVFLRVVKEVGGFLLVGNVSEAEIEIPETATAGEITALAAASETVIDNSLYATLGMAAGACVFFIGEKAPKSTIAVSTPAELSAALSGLSQDVSLPTIAAEQDVPPPPIAAETPPKAEEKIPPETTGDTSSKHSGLKIKKD